ncbi:MAG: hypothetical protein IKZ94_01245 [Lachnospiraceae bacterium]|nr:hypothetical protein [Lachnospiraceae bacterium]
MKKIYICSPYRGDVKKNTENVKRYCRDASYDGIPIAPHLYFTQFLNDTSSYDRSLGLRFGLALLRECEEIRVFADEVSEGMISEIAEARKLNIPIKFYNSEMEEIKYESLIINKRIGIGYRQIIEDTYNPGRGAYFCPYAGECGGGCEAGDKEGSKEGGSGSWRERILIHFNRVN